MLNQIGGTLNFIPQPRHPGPVLDPLSRGDSFFFDEITLNKHQLMRLDNNELHEHIRDLRARPLPSHSKKEYLIQYILDEQQKLSQYQKRLLQPIKKNRIKTKKNKTVNYLWNKYIQLQTTPYQHIDPNDYSMIVHHLVRPNKSGESDKELLLAILGIAIRNKPNSERYKGRMNRTEWNAFWQYFYNNLFKDILAQDPSNPTRLDIGGKKLARIITNSGDANIKFIREEGIALDILDRGKEIRAQEFTHHNPGLDITKVDPFTLWGADKTHYDKYHDLEQIQLRIHPRNRSRSRNRSRNRSASRSRSTSISSSSSSNSDHDNFYTVREKRKKTYRKRNRSTRRPRRKRQN